LSDIKPDTKEIHQIIT